MVALGQAGQSQKPLTTLGTGHTGPMTLLELLMGGLSSLADVLWGGSRDPDEVFAIRRV